MAEQWNYWGVIEFGPRTLHLVPCTELVLENLRHSYGQRLVSTFPKLSAEHFKTDWPKPILVYGGGALKSSLKDVPGVFSPIHSDAVDTSMVGTRWLPR